MPLTENEIKVFEQSGDLWNSFISLSSQHPDDINDFRFHIHALQNILLARSAYREINEPKKSYVKQIPPKNIFEHRRMRAKKEF